MSLPRGREPDERAVREALEEAGWWTYQPDRDPSADRWGIGFFRGVGWGLPFALVLWAGAIAGGVLLGWLAWQAVR